MPSGQSPARILVVDDEPDICIMLSKKLSAEGFGCRTAASGEEALACLEREPFDAVILDMQMPGMSGLEVLEVARQKYRQVAFLVVTGVTDPGVGITAMKQGAADYLLKPFELETVLASVKQALKKKRQQVQG